MHDLTGRPRVIDECRTPSNGGGNPLRVQQRLRGHLDPLRQANALQDRNAGSYAGLLGFPIHGDLNEQFGQEHLVSDEGSNDCLQLLTRNCRRPPAALLTLAVHARPTRAARRAARRSSSAARTAPEMHAVEQNDAPV